MPQLRAIALTITFGLALLTTPGVAAASTGPLLTLDPQKGPPGTTVRVTPILTTSPGECVALWDGQEVARFTCGVDPNGLILWTNLTVPATAAPGQHTITVCRPDCGGIDPAWEQSAAFAVLAVVPDLGKLHLPEARSQLKTASLTLGSVQGPADDPAARVVSQDPSPGTAVDPGSGVSVTVAVSPLVTVPDLRGHTRAEADTLVTRSQLVLRVRSGSGRVDTQDPAPGSQVPPGSVVTVTLKATAPPVLVTVPELRHRTLDEAEAAVRAVGLVLQSQGARAGTVETQRPAPGTRVPQGSTVTVTMTVPTTSTDNTTPTAKFRSTTTLTTVAIIAALAALVTLTTLTLRSPRQRRSRKWVRQHVRVDSDTVLSETDASETGPGPSRRVGLEPHPDHGSQTLEEAHR
jgi:beta-lactam-binding protein with PASTA domain